MKVHKPSDTVYITKKFIRDEEFSEIDFEFQDEFKIKEDQDYAIIELGRSHLDPCTRPIRIELLIETLKEMKMAGATHIEMDYHEDHIGYEISAFKYYFSKPDEILVYEQELSEEDQHNRSIRRADLQRQLNDLDNE